MPNSPGLSGAQVAAALPAALDRVLAAEVEGRVTAGQMQKAADVTIAAMRPAPKPRNIPLPLGGQALMYTRENLTQLYRCSHGELGRLLSRRMAPLPIRFDGQILWFVDEALRDQATAMRSLERWRKR